MKKAISFLLTAILMFSLCVSLASCDVQLDETPIETTTADTSIDLSQIPLYVQQESERVANDVESIRKDNSFVFGAISDVHTTGEDVASQGILHAGQALSYIDSLTSLDMVTLLGDVPVGYFTDDAVVSFDFVKQCFADVAKRVPFVQLQGNHDQYVSDTTEVAQQKYYDYIGANNVGTVTDSGNEFRNYGYRDFSDKKIRVIYLNTTDVSDAAVTTDYGVSNAQLTWLQNVALNLDDAEWGIIVLSHHPLNWYGMTPLLNVLDTYKGKGTGAELIAHFHGHIHNFRVETFGTNGVVSITIPNATFSRNNEYGTSSSYSDTVKTNYGDVDEYGNQRQYNKVAGTADETAFNVVVVNTHDKTISCINYGAGIHRVISYLDGHVQEFDILTYTNLADPNAEGWVNDSRMGSDGSAKPSDPIKYANNVVTNYIHISLLNKDVYLYVKGLDLTSKTTDNTSPGIGIYALNDDGTYRWIANRYLGQNHIISTNGDVTVYRLSDKITNDGGEWLRFTGTLLDGYTAEDVVITLGEPIINTAKSYMSNRNTIGYVNDILLSSPIRPINSLEDYFKKRVIFIKNGKAIKNTVGNPRYSALIYAFDATRLFAFF